MRLADIVQLTEHAESPSLHADWSAVRPVVPVECDVSDLHDLGLKDFFQIYLIMIDIYLAG